MVKYYVPLFFILTILKYYKNNETNIDKETQNMNIPEVQVDNNLENKDQNQDQDQKNISTNQLDNQLQDSQKTSQSKTNKDDEDYYQEPSKEIIKTSDTTLQPQNIQFKQYQDGDNFQKEQFKCLLKVLYKNTIDLSYLQMDSYLEDIKKIVNDEYDSNFPLMSLFNVRIINAINNLFIHFSNLSYQIRNYIIGRCNINISETKKRCEETFKKECHNDLDFELENPFAFNIRCRDLTPQKSNQKYIRSYGTKCYHQCPLFYKELYNKCEMPQAYENKLFSSYEECLNEKFKSIDPFLIKLANEHKVKIECIPYMNNTFYVPECLPGFQRQFYLFCIPDCPNGMIPSEKYCLKRNPLEIPNNISFNFTDLFLDDVHFTALRENQKKNNIKVDMNIVSKETMDIYRELIKNKKVEIELQNKN